MSDAAAQVRILFVCMGNICRSPTAEGVFRALLAREGLEERVLVDSAGTGAWHVGCAPDHRSQAAAGKRGYDLSTQRARRVTPDDFDRFDLIVAMDSLNVSDLCAVAPPGTCEKVHLLLDFADPPSEIRDVPDPYRGNGDGFARVLDLVESGCAGLLTRVRAMLRDEG